jgi:DNA-binding MarR family transcriptional regulator
MHRETDTIVYHFSFTAVGSLMGKIHRAMKRFIEGQMKTFEITPPQFEVLLTLWERDGLALNELGKILARDGPTITGIIDRMEQKQLVNRKRDPSDRRCIKVVLTPKALGLKEKMTSHLQASLKDIAGDLSQIEMSQLESILTKMLMNIEQKIVPRMHGKLHATL